jgi:hypothetical protein
MSLTSYRAAPPRGCGLVCVGVVVSGLGRPGGDLLSRVLRRSTIGAEGFHGRVRDGIGCLAPRHDHQVSQDQRTGIRYRMSEKKCFVAGSPLRCEAAGRSSRSSD